MGDFGTFLTGLGVIALVVNGVLLLCVLIILSILLRFVITIKKEAQLAVVSWKTFVASTKTRVMVAGLVGKILSTLGSNAKKHPRV